MSAVSKQTDDNEYLNGSERSSQQGSLGSSNRIPTEGIPTEDYVISENHFKMPDSDRKM